ncbi:Regulatory protein AfsR [Colletotrichum gloeosporioides]|uniref:Regulatory protein AfsR n=1 Tax=Colletotrichum gloeosporioides TaxID=474922 RepID=A0A8H4CAD7_COLGL|nr:Regulatory protein AfsR [Colletotrichum gloeosporioides]KAF3800370.1 Regulatory protein AfsR [Colletotrichum gloeosporioides]
MDPLSVISSTIGIIGAVASAYETIKKIQNLPKAFDEVNKNLPLVRGVLQRVYERIQRIDPSVDENSASIREAINTCHDKVEILQKIFATLEEKCKDRDADKTWKRARAWYREAMRGMQADRVEGLMKEILDRMRILAMSQVFSLNDDLDEIKEAINSLSEVDPSLDDSEIEMGAIYAQQTNQDHATGTQYNMSGGVLNTGNNSGNTFGNVGTLTFASHHIPNGKNLNFVGRSEIMRRLQTILRDKECESVALCGLGGAGKSEIALSFAHWVKDTMPDHSVLWMSALSSGSIDKSYGDIAHKVGLDCSEGLGVKTALQRYLSSGIASPWVFIIDNADDEAMLEYMRNDSDGNSVLPRDDGCLTLFTTRSWDVAQCVSQGNVIDVEAMNEDDAKSLLARLIGKNRWSEPDGMVDILLEKLTCLPLAIAHAAAYMKRNRKSTSDYVNLMAGTDENLIKLLQQRMATGKATASVLTTWAISFEQINTHHPQAATLLSFCSQIEPKGIPRTILPDFTNEIDLDQAIGTLLSYAFIRDRGDMRQTFDMHSLVHLAAGVWLREMKGFKAATEAAVIRLAQLLPDSLEEIIEEWWAYLPHACRLLMSIDMVEVDLTVKAWKLGCYVVLFLYCDCRYHESAQIVERVLELCERWWNKDEPVIMFTRELLIESLSELGLRQRKRAVEIAELVLEQTRRSRRTDPADEIKAELNLIWAYLSADQKNEASDRAAILAERLRKFDVHEHTWVLQAKVDLGSILLDTGKHSECIDMLEGALVHHNETGHDDKLQLLKVKRQLASAYKARYWNVYWEKN